MELLLKEAEDRKKEFIEDVDTLFIGGGTPSLLSPELIMYLTGTLYGIIPSGRPEEITIESNPGTVTEQWVSVAVKAGINRLSLGMQAFQPKLLEVLGRIHEYDEVETTVRMARAYGINNINIDLIFGIPGQNLEQWAETLDKTLALDPEHISTYGLIPEEETPMKTDLDNGTIKLPDPDLERTMYDTAISMLSNRGFRQYEISNFAKPGFECCHNTGYWKQIPYMGLGLSAASMEILQSGKKGMICRRRTNPDCLADYERMICEHSGPDDVVLVSPSEARFETMMLGLRMNEGVDENRFRKMHGIGIEEVFGKKLHLLEAAGLVTHSGFAWKLTRRGFDIQNSILVELMDE